MKRATSASRDATGNAASALRVELSRIRRAPRVPQIQQDADADAAVGDVEGGVDVVAEVEIEEVHDVFIGDAIDEVADDTAAEQTEAHLHGRDAQTERAPPKENRYERAEREDGEQGAFPGKDTPRRAGVADVDEIKETGDHHDILNVVVVVIVAERDGLNDPELGELIEHEEAQRDDPEQAISADAFPSSARPFDGRGVEE